MVPSKFLVIALYKLTAGRFDRYMQMFNKTIKKSPEEEKENIKNKIIRQIKYVMDKLKREDRIMWYLKKYRLRFHEPQNPEARLASSRVGDLLHFISNAETNNYQTVLNYEFKPDKGVRELLEDLENLEKIEVAKREEDSRLIDHNEYDEDGISDMIHFPDGWAWYQIENEVCELEGDAMRHCGNTGSPKEGDRVLSLREPIQDGDKTFYKPHATFIINNGILGEMKGYANNKPKKSTYPYIKELLLSDYVEFIFGGGYKPENNFSFDDLSQDDQKELLAKKPWLSGGVNEYFKTKGATDSLKTYVIDHYFADNSEAEIVDIEGKPYVKMAEYKNLTGYASDKDDELVRAIGNHEDSYDAIYIERWDDSELEDIAVKIKEIDSKFYDAMKANSEEEYDDPDDWWREYDTQLGNGLLDAAHADYESMLWKAFETFVNEPGIDHQQHGVKFHFPKEKYILDEPIQIVISLEDFFDAMGNDETDDALEYLVFDDSYDRHKFSYPNWHGLGTELDYSEIEKIAAERAIEMIQEEYPDLEKKAA